MKAMRGLSLVELLTVLLIVGLLAGVASLSFGNLPGSMEDGENQARGLLEQVNLTQELAVISGLPAGLRLGPARDDAGGWDVEIVQYSNRVWQPWAATQGAMQGSTARLPAGITLSVALDGEWIAREQIQRIHARGEPVLLVLPTGELPAFELLLESEGTVQASLRVTERGDTALSFYSEEG
ncbi:MAG: prepilin-type N-terminal cleavage/methylation domain-containing protein [Pseudohongiellaceae bacterium]